MRCFAFGGGGSGVIVSFWKKHKTMVCAICVSLPQQVFVAGPPPKKKKKRKVSVSTCNSCYESTNIFGSSEIGGHSAAEALAGFEGGDNSLVNTACCSRCRYTR